MKFRTSLLLLLLPFTLQINFDRTIVASYFPFYKILLSLGDCKNRTLYSDREIWPAVKLNRVIDILYTSSDSSQLVSTVEIYLVVNNTEFIATAYTDTGSTEFRAQIIFPVNTGTTFYRIDIYTCSSFKAAAPVDAMANEEDVDSDEDTEVLLHMPFYLKNKSPAGNSGTTVAE